MNEDVRYGLFCWSEAKEKANILRHGLSFREAIEAFSDVHRIVAKDDKHSLEEERLFCIGRVSGRVATVRFTYREELVRVFGAGFWRKGRKLYEETNPD